MRTFRVQFFSKHSLKAANSGITLQVVTNRPANSNIFTILVLLHWSDEYAFKKKSKNDYSANKEKNYSKKKQKFITSLKIKSRIILSSWNENFLLQKSTNERNLLTVARRIIIDN